MSRGDPSRLNWRVFAAFVVACTMACSGNDFAWAAKPQAPPPPPSGTIYFKSASSFWAIKPDGSGSTQVLPANFYTNLFPGGPYDLILPRPCERPQGPDATNDRWWIVGLATGMYDEGINSNGVASPDWPHHDLFAVRTNPANRTQLQFLQLTDLYGRFTVNYIAPHWSNDSNERAGSFVAALVRDIRDTFIENEDGTTSFDVRESTSVFLRLPLTALDITSGYSAGDFVPFGADPLDEAEVDQMLSPNLAGGRQGMHSPDGTLYLGNDLANSRLFIDDIQQPDFNNPFLVLWDDSFGAPSRMVNGQWSPDGTTVGFDDALEASTKGGSIWVQPATGETPPVKLLAQTSQNGNLITYSNPVWSPDSKHVAAVRREYRNGAFNNSRLVRIAIGTTKIVNVSTAINFDVTCVPLRWCAN